MADAPGRTRRAAWPELGRGPGRNVVVHGGTVQRGTADGGTVHLKVVTGQRTLVHLVPLSGAGATRSRPAVRVGGRRTVGLPEDLEAFDPALLAEPIWTERTMCGLIWWQMATYALELELALAGLGTTRGDGHVCRLCATSALASAAARAAHPSGGTP